MTKSNRLRWLILVPAFFAVASEARAETHELECREIDAGWTESTVWECRRDWLPAGSRISEEQRKTLNAVVLLTVVAPMSRGKR